MNKKIRELVRNFTGEILDVRTNPDPNETLPEIGEMSEDAKKLFTLYQREILAKGEFFEQCGYQNPFTKPQNSYKNKIILDFFDHTATFPQRLAAGKYDTRISNLYKALVNQIYSDYPLYKKHELVFIKGWKICHKGKKFQISKALKGLFTISSAK